MSSEGADANADLQTPIGVTRQASEVPEDVRQATAALSSDLAYALLITIQQSGVTRFTWLRQELQAPNQDIVEALGPLHSRGLIERTTVGKAEGRESAYVLTDLGEAILTALQSIETDKAQSTSDEPTDPDADDGDTTFVTLHPPL